VLLLPEPLPQRLEARLHRGLVRSGRRHGGRLCGVVGESRGPRFGSASCDFESFWACIGRIRNRRLAGVRRRGGGIKGRKAGAGGGRRALAWRRGKKDRGRRDGGRWPGRIFLYILSPNLKHILDLIRI
jgi:hypothetical protein